MIVRILFSVIGLFSFKFCSSQVWKPLDNIAIQYTYVADRGDTTCFFRKDSTSIGVPIAMSVDFYNLFREDIRLFDTITQNTLHIIPDMLNDNAFAALSAAGVKSLVYTIKREIKKEKGTEHWILTIIHDEGRCWPNLSVRRLKDNSGRILFLVYDGGMCEI